MLLGKRLRRKRPVHLGECRWRFQRDQDIAAQLRMNHEKLLIGGNGILDGSYTPSTRTLRECGNRGATQRVGAGKDTGPALMLALGETAQVASGVIGEATGFGILHNQTKLRIQFQPLGLAAQDSLVDLVPAFDSKSQAPAATLHAHRKEVGAFLELERENKVVGSNIGKLISESRSVEKLLPIEIPSHPPVGSRSDEHFALLGGFNAGEGPDNLLGRQHSKGREIQHTPIACDRRGRFGDAANFHLCRKFRWHWRLG